MWIIKKEVKHPVSGTKIKLELLANSLEEAEEFVLKHCGNIKFQQADNGLIAVMDSADTNRFDVFESCQIVWKIYQLKTIYEVDE